jgi:hypothetical protein
MAIEHRFQNFQSFQSSNSGSRVHVQSSLRTLDSGKWTRGREGLSLETLDKNKTASPSRFTRLAVLLAVVLVAMRVCHRTLRMLAKWADRLRV